MIIRPTGVNPEADAKMLRGIILSDVKVCLKIFPMPDAQQAASPSPGNFWRSVLKSGSIIAFRDVRGFEEAAARKAENALSGFIIVDENFFIHASRVREFLECARAGRRALSTMKFGSVKGRSRFTADEIAERGSDKLRAGFERYAAIVIRNRRKGAG